MAISILVASFLLVTVSTLLLFWSIGITPNSLLFSRDDAKLFRDTRTRLFRWFVVSATIFTTLTSLATVYVFFLGSSKLFGIYILAAPVSIALSFLVTVPLTQRILKYRPDFAALITAADRTSGVVARIVWTNEVGGRRTSRIVKWISLVNIASVLWLEFSVFGDLAAGILTHGGESNESHLVAASVVVAGAVFCVFFLLLRYGLRGFVMADVLHSPFVVASTIAALIGIYYSAGPRIYSEPIFTPLIPMRDVALFVVHVFALNLVFVLVTEGHWFRLWLFDQQENKKQFHGTAFTAVTWAILGIAGCLALAITPLAGTPGFLPVAQAIQDAHPAWAMLFWLGATAALFSVADAQIYNLVIVHGFDSRTGEVNKKIDRPARPIFSAATAAILFSGIYLFTRFLNIPFEKLVFVLFPFCLNILPAFLPIAFGREPRAIWVLLSIAGYSGLSLVGLMMPDQALTANLAAALIPVACSFIAILASKAAPAAAGSPQ